MRWITIAGKKKSRAPRFGDVLHAILLAVPVALFTFLPMSASIGKSAGGSVTIFSVLTALLLIAIFYLYGEYRVAEYPAFCIVVSLLAVGSIIVIYREQNKGERETMTQEVQSNTRYFYSNGTVYKQKGEQPPVPLGTKWLKVFKILLGIGVFLCFFLIWFYLAGSVALTTILPPALVAVDVIFCLADAFLIILAFTALSSLSASRFKYIILLFAFRTVVVFVSTFSMCYTAGPSIRFWVAVITTAIFTLVWSLPNVLYFMHRKCMFVGTDPEADVKIGKPAAEASPVEDVPKPERPAAQAPAPQVKARIKVVPHRVGSDQPVAAEAVKPAPAAAVVQPTAAKRYDWKMIAIIALAALLVAAVVYILVDKGVFDANGTSPSRTESVYVYGDSRIYHRKNCYYSKKPVVSKMMSEYEAVKEGYSPCHRCMG